MAVWCHHDGISQVAVSGEFLAVLAWADMPGHAVGSQFHTAVSTQHLVLEYKGVSTSLEQPKCLETLKFPKFTQI